MIAAARPILVLLAVLALVASGCGKDSSSSKRLSKSQYIDRSNVILTDFEHDTNAGTAKIADPSTYRQVAATTADKQDTEIRRMRKLHPPKEWETLHATLVTAMAKERDGLRTIANSKAGDTKALALGLKQIHDGGVLADGATRKINADR